MGPDFTSKFKEQKSEIEKRITAFHSVHDLDLQEISSACVAELETRLKKINAVLN